MKHDDYDLVVIGGGSGGVRAARVAASLGARVALVEARDLGGTCVHRGCVPKKLLVYASRFAGSLRHAAGYGWSVGECSHDWPGLMQSVRAELSRLGSLYAGMLDRSGVSVVRGTGRVTGPHTVAVGSRELTGGTLLVATGGRAFVPNLPGHEHGITSDDVFVLPERPARLAIVGAGYIGAEMACLFNGLGSTVHMIHQDTRILRGFDADLTGHLLSEMTQSGIQVHLEYTVQAVSRTADGLQVVSSHALNQPMPANGNALTVDAVLFATGRVPLTQGLGLAEVGVQLDHRGAVVVNAQYQSTVDTIYAVGDVVDQHALTPVAIHQGALVANNLFGKGPLQPFDIHNIPTAVFSQPALAMVGLTESQACAKLGAVQVYESRFKPMLHTLTGSSECTYLKVLVDPKTNQVVGFHMASPDAPEIMQGLAVAIKAGVTKAQLDRTVGIHPTAAEEFVTLRTLSRERRDAS